MGLSKIKNDRGMGLLPTVILTGVVGLIVAGMASSILTMIRSQTSVAATTEAALLTDQLKASLTSETACANALVGKLPDTVATGADPVTPLTGVTVRLADNNMNLSEGSALVDSSGAPLGYSLYKFRIAFDDPPAVGSNGIPSLTDGPDTVFNRRIKVVVQLQKTSEGIFSPMSQKKEFYIDANVKTADNKIKSCAARSIASESCFQMGGIWNPSISDPVAGTRCLSNQSCQYGGSYSPYSSTDESLFPTQFPNMMMDPPDYGCPAGFFTKQTGAVALASADGKSNLSTTSAPIYSCLRCAQQDRLELLALNTLANALDAAASSLAQDAIAQTDQALATSSTLSAGCVSALQVAGRWSVSYSQSDCGAVPGDPGNGNVCDPRTAPMSGSSSCGYFDSTTMTYIPLFSAYTATCVDTVPLPAYCHYP